MEWSRSDQVLRSCGSTVKLVKNLGKGWKEEIKAQGQEWRRAASLSGNAETGFKLGQSR